MVSRVVELHKNQQERKINNPEVNSESIVEQPQEVVLRRSHKERKFTILNDYVVYLQDRKMT